MRSMGRALLLLLVVAFVAGVWDARYGQEGTPGRAPAPFGTEPVERDRPARPAPELRSVRGDERDGYDRVVFTFEGSMPGYRVRYVPQVTGAGGRRVSLRGTAFLEVAFEPARARDPDGTPTFPAATITPSFPELRQVRFAGDFEGQVSFGLGVAGRGGFRVSELRNPTRVAVDVR
ncbi:MAG TPA: hypothetical protein VG409_10590 [Actinomycetota bacterium]|nr:hypothetical protein [Actinomycetota bacterium]